MLNVVRVVTSKLKLAVAPAAILLVTHAPALAMEFTAGIVVTKMDEGDRYPFLAGIVEGLAYARYKKDGDKIDGMKCIFEWFYDTKSRPQEILDTFRRFPDYAPAAVMSAMVVKECGS